MNINLPVLSIAVIIDPSTPPASNCIASILNQQEVEVELILINNGIDTADLKNYPFQNDIRIKWVEYQKSANKAFCYNQALKSSKALFFAIVESTYIFRPFALKKLLDYLNTHANTGKVSCYYYQIKEKKTTNRVDFHKQQAFFKKKFPEGQDFRVELLKHGNRLGPFGIYRRAVLEKLGFFNEDLSKNWCLDLDIRLSNQYSISVLPKFLFFIYIEKKEISLIEKIHLWQDRSQLILQLSKNKEIQYFHQKKYSLYILLLSELYSILGLPDFRRLWLEFKKEVHKTHQFINKEILQKLFNKIYFFTWNYINWWPLEWYKKKENAKLDQPIRLGYFLWQFPTLSQTFIQREVKAIRASGMPLCLFAETVDEMDYLEEKAKELIHTTVYLLPFDKHQMTFYKRFFFRKNPIRFIHLFLFVLTHRYHQVKNFNHDRIIFFKALYLAGKLKDNNITHIHSPWADINAFIVMIAAKLLGISYSFQGRAYDLHRISFLHSMIPKFKHARFVITNTQYNVNRIQDITKRSLDGKVCQIYNGIDLHRFQPCANLTNKKALFRILSVGRLIEQKGYVYLLKALRILKDRGLSFTCEIIGGPEEPLYLNYHLQLKKLHIALELEEEVSFLGTLPFDKVLEKYKEVDLFVLPCVIAEDGSRDIIPNAVLEAMAMKLPIVSTTIVGLPEMIENNVSGILISPNDEYLLAKTIEELMKEESLRQRLGENARKRIEDKFDIHKNIKQFVDLYSHRLQ